MDSSSLVPDRWTIELVTSEEKEARRIYDAVRKLFDEEDMIGSLSLHYCTLNHVTTK